MPKITMAMIKRANKEAGQYFWSAGTKRFFGREKFENPGQGPYFLQYPVKWDGEYSRVKVRAAKRDGSIKSPIREFRYLDDARHFVKMLNRRWHHVQAGHIRSNRDLEI